MTHASTPHRTAAAIAQGAALALALAMLTGACAQTEPDGTGPQGPSGIGGPATIAASGDVSNEVADAPSTASPPPPFGNVFVQPYQDCRAPLDGQAPGSGSDDQVCTQVSISGCTEPGRRFADYGTCEDVLTQRPYFPVSVRGETDPADPRLSDQDYLDEMGWLTEQVQACACTCCHDSSSTPWGAAAWDLNRGPLWLDSVSDGALAMLGGFSDSSAFGAHDPAENNGFDRRSSGLPTQNPARLKSFVLGELRRRGRDEEWAESRPAFGGPLVSIEGYSPGRCAAGNGIDAGGRLVWTGGTARYVYVLEADSQSPGVPPDRDLPEGTLWRLDVSHLDPAIASGIPHGEVPEGASQRWPEEGISPDPLVTGRDYYLYVLRDITVPITRCIFTR